MAARTESGWSIQRSSTMPRIFWPHSGRAQSGSTWAGWIDCISSGASGGGWSGRPHARDEKGEAEAQLEAALAAQRAKLQEQLDRRDDETKQLHVKFAVFREQQEQALREEVGSLF